MKDKILKIAGVKSEKEFYKKYPSEEAFMKVHGKAFKKAQVGTYIGGTSNSFKPVNYQDMYNETDYSITGSTDATRNEEAYKQAQLAATQKQGASGGGGLGGALGQLGSLFGGEGSDSADGAKALAGAIGKNGKKLKKAQNGTQAPLEEDYPDTNSYNAAFNAWRNNQVASPSMIGTPSAQSAAPSIGGTPNYTIGTAKNDSSASNEKKITDAIGKYAGPAGKVVQGFQKLKEEKKAVKRAEQAAAVSDISLQAANTTPEETERKYVRPEDIVNSGEAFFPIYGVGTNPLARNGAEIANTFAPNTLYDDLGYEPLSDSERYKQYQSGGKLPWDKIGNIGGDLAGSFTGNNAGGDIGGEFGGAIGSFFGPAGNAIGKTAGKLIGGVLDRNPTKIKKANDRTQSNIQKMAFQQGAQGIQGQYGSFMKDGGWVSNDWQPQTITKFGEYNLNELLRSPKDADMLRAGGHLKQYTPPSESAMSTERPMMEEGGELQTHWGGYAEPMSYNPYLPEGGETVMFRGQSHDESDGKGNTGIGITYGDNPVEVERGEPAIKLKDGSSGEPSLVVFGNLKIPHEILGDSGAKGKNFKRYVSEISKGEAKSNKAIEKAVLEIDKLDVDTPFDRLRFNALNSTIMGNNMKLKDFAEKKMNASSLQNAMNDTVEEYGLKTTDKGIIKAQAGISASKDQEEEIMTKGQDLPEVIFTSRIPKPVVPNVQLERISTGPDTSKISLPKVDPDYLSKVMTGEKKKSLIDYIDYINNILPNLRPSNAEELDPNQLMGEMFALSNNQIEPIPVQTIQPQIDMPYDVSFQDSLNENEASFRAQQRMVGYNPALQSQLAAQKYGANQKILAEQFRMNQAMKNQVYKENRNLLNDTNVKNLGILGDQYNRQQQAKSNTKATTQAALDSISSKYAQNKLENRTLQTYENMYNYRFDPKFRAQNMNPLFNPNMPTVSGAVPIYDSEGKIIGMQDLTDKTSKKETSKKEDSKKESSEKRSGGKIKLNSSIVKALKNI